MIFVDSNIPMYLVGADHPLKFEARRLVDRIITERRRMVTSTQVFQEILHRYVAISRRDAIEIAFGLLRSVVDEVFPIEQTDVVSAKGIVQAQNAISARDALHVAVMRHHGIEEILSFDRGFDACVELVRIGS